MVISMVVVVYVFLNRHLCSVLVVLGGVVSVVM